MSLTTKIHFFSPISFFKVLFCFLEDAFECKVYGNEETDIRGKAPNMGGKMSAGMYRERGSLWVETMNSTLRIILKGF